MARRTKKTAPTAGPTREAIRAAVTARHGGLGNATDAQIRRVWDALSRDAQAAYLTDDETQEEPTDHADRDRSEPDV